MSEISWVGFLSSGRQEANRPDRPGEGHSLDRRALGHSPGRRDEVRNPGRQALDRSLDHWDHLGEARNRSQDPRVRLAAEVRSTDPEDDHRRAEEPRRALQDQNQAEVRSTALGEGDLLAEADSPTDWQACRHRDGEVRLVRQVPPTAEDRSIALEDDRSGAVHFEDDRPGVGARPTDLQADHHRAEVPVAADQIRSGDLQVWADQGRE